MVPPKKRISPYKATVLFFKKAFPRKVPYIKTGEESYFQEWVRRFSSGSPERWADSANTRIILKMRKNGYVW